MNYPVDWRTEYPFSSNWLEIGGSRYHYVDEGQGPVLLMIHGNPTWSFLWRKLIGDLQDRYRCIAPDHMGCGLSDKPHDFDYSLPVHAAALERLIDELDLNDVTLLAHDWGGPIGLQAAVARRDRFSRLVLFNTGAFPPPFIPWRIRACRVPFIGEWAVQRMNLFALAAQRMAVHHSDRISACARAGLLAPYDRPSNRIAITGFVRDIPSSSKHPTWVHLERLEADLALLRGMPVQMIWGMQDWCFRPECLDRLLQSFPEAEVHRLHDVGHWVTEEAPDKVSELVDDFLTRTAQHDSMQHDG